MPPLAVHDDRAAEHVLEYVLGVDDGDLRAPHPAVGGEPHHEAFAFVGTPHGSLEHGVGRGVRERWCRLHPWQRQGRDYVREPCLDVVGPERPERRASASTCLACPRLLTRPRHELRARRGPRVAGGDPSSQVLQVLAARVDGRFWEARSPLRTEESVNRGSSCGRDVHIGTICVPRSARRRLTATRRRQAVHHVTRAGAARRLQTKRLGVRVPSSAQASRTMKGPGGFHRGPSSFPGGASSHTFPGRRGDDGDSVRPIGERGACAVHRLRDP